MASFGTTALERTFDCSAHALYTALVDAEVFAKVCAFGVSFVLLCDLCSLVQWSESKCEPTAATSRRTTGGQASQGDTGEPCTLDLVV